MSEFTTPNPQAPTALDARALLFLAILLVGWTSFPPFPDLGTNESITVGDGTFIATYAAFAVMGSIAALMIWRTDGPALRSLLTPSYAALAIWIGVTCTTSQDVGASLKRVIMLGFVAISCAALSLLPRNRDQFASLLAFVASTIIFLSYFGVIFAPQFSIHQATDLGEPQLAGDWRGLFGHKNMASAIFSILSFVGIFVLRTRRPVIGWIIFALSIIFVLASGGKSSTGICVATIGVSFLAVYTSNIALWSLIVFGPLVLLNILGVGSVLSPTASSLVASVAMDATFTGRIDIWSFAVAKASEALVFGHGLGAFWGSQGLLFGQEQSTIWAGGAAHAHNGYLDAVISMGLPGLAVTIGALVIQPARDVRSVLERGEEPALALLFLQIWIFSLYLNSLESFFYDRAHSGWVALLFAVFGMRFLSNFRVLR
jgi:O-antigen ligase